MRLADLPEEMNGHYGPKVSFDVSSRTATITVKNGSFKVTSVSDQSILVDDPTTLGVVSRNNPMVIRYGNFSGDVVLHFVLAETDDKCLSYDEATEINSAGQKVGTYEFDLTLQLKAQQETPKK